MKAVLAQPGQEHWLVPAAEKAELGRIGWHTFRHSHSTLLHALGVDLKVQRELLRHAGIRTTMNIYTLAVPTAPREANSKKLPRKSATHT
jgi:integrase